MMWKLFAVEEAIHSTAMEHARDCDCIICRAADGDPVAKAEIYRSV